MNIRILFMDKNDDNYYHNIWAAKISVYCDIFSLENYTDKNCSFPQEAGFWLVFLAGREKDCIINL